MLKNDRIINANTFNLLETERNYRRHVARLVSISQDKTNKVNQSRSIDVQTARLNNCMNASKRVKTLQLLQVQKDNDRLLGKLLRINQGDKKSVTGSGPPLQVASARVSTDNNNKSVVNKSVAPEPQFKSLNQVARKRDVLRIINENVRLTEKIIFQESQFAKDKMAKEYQTSREYSLRLRKLRPNDDKTVKIGHGGIVLSKDLRIKNSFKYLPPLEKEMKAYTQNYSRASSVPRLPSERTSAYDSRTVKEKFDELSRSLLAGADMTYVESLANKHDSQRDSVGTGEDMQNPQEQISMERVDQKIVDKYLKEPEHEPENSPTQVKSELSLIVEQSEGTKSPEMGVKKGKEAEKEKDKGKGKKK